jgi:aspartyl/asparaginyl beta-hydroxylase (cupin superfamily)
MFVATAPPFARTLRGAWQAIRDEAIRLPADAYAPWVQRRMYGKGWSLAVLHALGRELPTLDECPATRAALAAIPGLAMAAFSRLAPGAHVRPHTGWGDRVFRLHLGLVVPEGGWLRVGRETRAWRAGGVLVFDDTVEHEAKNPSEEDRIVLMLDYARPGFEAEPYDPAKLPDEVAALADVPLTPRSAR